MKYMHFRASCSYAALASIMEQKGIDTEDFQIALEMKLPWLFAKEGASYVSGPMLQGARWFDLWLLPRGYRMIEKTLPRERLCSFLQAHPSVMLGVQTAFGKHAVVFTGYDGAYHFLSPTYENSGEPAEFALEDPALLSAVSEETMVGEVQPAAAEPQDLVPLLRRSVTVLRENCGELIRFASEKHAPDAYAPAMNRLFRPLLLDGITMLELAGETALAQEFTALQGQFLSFLRGTREEPLREALSLNRLQALAEQYASLIEKQG